MGPEVRFSVSDRTAGGTTSWVEAVYAPPGLFGGEREEVEKT
jgi:hypothetical protein